MSKKAKLRDLIRQAPSHEETDVVFREMMNGPPIVAAILGCALVEYELDSLLRTRFGKITQTRWDEMTGENGPFYTLHAKIIAAHGFGFFDDATRDHLNRIRNIRNAFAHAKVVFDFSHPLVIRELRSAQLPAKPHSTTTKRIKRVRSSKTKPHEAFQWLCATAYSTLMRRMTAYYRTSAKNYRRARMKRVNPFHVGLFGLGNAFGEYRGGLIGSSYPSHIDDPIAKALLAVRSMQSQKSTEDEDK